MSIFPLVAVIGPVEPDLLSEFTAHYRRLGVDRFLLAFHFPDGTPTPARQRLLERCRRVAGEPAIVSSGPWHEHTNRELRDELRRRAGGGWHLLADSDEFQVYPAPLAEVIAGAEAAGAGVVGGLMLDRVAADGSTPGWSPTVGLDRAYPLGGFLTHTVLRGDARKVVAAHSSVDVADGNHRSPGRRPVNDPVVAVHHFKWRGGVLDYLRERVRRLGSDWQELGPALRQESQRLLTHVDSFGGRIDVSGTTLPMRPVTLTGLPDWWQVEARDLVDRWQPPRSSARD